MADSTKFFTYRCSNLPKYLQRSDIQGSFSAEDADRITTISLAPCIHLPSTFNVASITFNGEPSFRRHLVNGEGKFPCPSIPGYEQIKVDDTFYGLTPLNTVSGNVKADLIAITGLAGRAFASWQHKNGAMWLRDFLPFDIPDTRVFIYGYPSKLHKSPSHASIQDYAEGFSKAILTVRAGLEDAQRPLILIGHSLGCIVIKQAIVEALSFATPIPGLYRSICGMVFFGAPHRGLHNPALQSIISGKPPEGLVRDLRPDSSLLISLNQRFPYACNSIKVISCYETHNTKTPELVDPSNPESEWQRTGPPEYLVPQTSACLDWPVESETRIAVHADHSEIAKLSNSPGSEYFLIKHEIKELVNTAPDILKRRQESYRAKQDVLDNFFMLQYEYAWFKAWETRLLERVLSRNSEHGSESPASIPYGHPAHPSISEIYMIMDMLGPLLASHSIPRQSGGQLHDERTNTSGELHPPHVSLWGMPQEFRPDLSTQGGPDDTLGQLECIYSIEKWSNSDREVFGDMMVRFRQANQKLSQSDPPFASMDLIASSKVLSSIIHDSERLGRVESVSQLDRLYSSLSKRASLKRQYQEGSGAKMDNKLLFPVNSIKMKRNTESPDHRFITTFTQKKLTAQDGSQDQKWVLVEWRSYGMAKTVKTQKQAKDQAFQLAHDLSIHEKPPLLKTLNCVGFIQDMDERQFGFLFEIPGDVDITTAPLTLNAYLHGSKINGASIPLPTFGERIKLAQSLAYSIAELHGAGILHKSLHSGNVLFFPARFTNAISTSAPFIGGFEVSRPDQDGQLSLALEGKRFDIYKHPELRHPSNVVQGRPQFVRKHDVYSLGLMLLEIGVWKRLESFFEDKGLQSSFESSRRLVDITRANLPHQMGVKYCEAVLECIDCDQASLSRTVPRSLSAESKLDRNTDDERGGVSLELFIEKVIKRLEGCHCLV